MTMRWNAPMLFKQSVDILGPLTVGGVPVTGGSSGGGGADVGEGIPLTDGETFYVDDGTTGADDNHSGTNRSYPLATIDGAIGKCTANRGDIILVSPGHTDTPTGAAGINCDIAGISIIGMGQGEDRPFVTFTGTDDAATLAVGAANVTIRNLIFVCDDDGQTIMIDVNDNDCEISACEFRGTSTTKQWLTAIDVNGGAANACDRTKIFNNVFTSMSVGANNAIGLDEVAAGCVIAGNVIIGDFADAGIHNPTGKILTELRIEGNAVRNMQTGDHAIELVSACTGWCVGNFLMADTAASILDPGSLFCAGNWGQMAIDKPGFIVPLDLEDQVTNPIGVDDADNAFASTNVVANEDGSLLERLEQVQEAVNKGTGTALAANKSLVDALGTDGTTVTDAAASVLGAIGADSANNTFASTLVAANENGSVLERLEQIQEAVNIGTGTSLAANKSLVDAVGFDGVTPSVVFHPSYGLKVNKTLATLPASTTQNIFTVAGGRVLVMLMTGEVTTVVQAQACNLSVNLVTTVGGDIVLASVVDINADEAGTLYLVEGDGTALVPQSSGVCFNALVGGGMILAEGTINIQTSATNTGATAWELWYWPLDSGATVVTA